MVENPQVLIPFPGWKIVMSGIRVIFKADNEPGSRSGARHGACCSNYGLGFTI